VFILWNIYFFISYSYFIVGSIVFSVLFYAFFLFFIIKKKQRALIFVGEQKYAAKKIDNSTAQELVEKLEILMQLKKLYLNPNLKSSDVSVALNISTHQFSQLLNDNLKKSFSVYINHYRIEEAKQLIKSNSKYTLEAIGNESGFNSKSTFYTTFKRIVGVTPSTYKEQL
jgi:AraC-like DNA-binding protein